MELNLKPCFECGGKPKVKKAFLSSLWTIHCCGYAAQTRDKGVLETAEAWNRIQDAKRNRTPDESLREIAGKYELLPCEKCGSKPSLFQSGSTNAIACPIHQEWNHVIVGTPGSPLNSIRWNTLQRDLAKRAAAYKAEAEKPKTLDPCAMCGSEASKLIYEKPIVSEKGTYRYSCKAGCSNHGVGKTAWGAGVYWNEGQKVLRENHLRNGMSPQKEQRVVKDKASQDPRLLALTQTWTTVLMQHNAAYLDKRSATDLAVDAVKLARLQVRAMDEFNEAAGDDLWK